MASYPTAVTGESPNATGLEPACLRGPLRKPQQSGFGLWVGNLPSSIDIMMLKDHFSSEATGKCVPYFEERLRLCQLSNKFSAPGRFEQIPRLTIWGRSTGVPSSNVQQGLQRH